MKHCCLIAAQFIIAALCSSMPATAQRWNDGGLNRPSASSDPMAGDTASSGVISGVVRTMDGRAVNQASVEIHDTLRGNRIVSGRTDASGAYALYNIPPGDYEITATSGISGAHERVRLDSMSRIATVDFRLPDKTADGNTLERGSTVTLSQYRIPAKARALYEKAAQAMAHGKFEQAREKVDAALAHFPKFAEALTLRGILKSNNGDDPAAIADFQQAIQCDSNYPLAYVALASSLNAVGKFDDSLLTLNQAERLAPNMWQTYFERARASIGKGQYANGLRDVDRASELKGGPQAETPAMHLVRGYALAGMNDAPRATHEIETYLASESNGRAADAAREVLNQLRTPTVSATK